MLLGTERGHCGTDLLRVKGKEPFVRPQRSGPALHKYDGAVQRTVFFQTLFTQSRNDDEGCQPGCPQIVQNDLFLRRDILGLVHQQAFLAFGKIQLERREKIDVLGFLQRWQDDGDGVGRALTEPLCLNIGNIAEFLYGIFYQLYLFDADLSGLVQNIGNGAVGYAGFFGDIVDGWHRIFPLFADGLFYDNILNGQKLQEKK